MVMVELTVPWEERCEEAYQRKKMKDASIAEEIRILGMECVGVPSRNGQQRLS